LNDSLPDDGFVINMAKRFNSLSAENRVPAFLVKEFLLQSQASLSRLLERISRVLSFNSHLLLELIPRTAKIRGSQVLNP
jgi:hypothetical protein